MSTDMHTGKTVTAHTPSLADETKIERPASHRPLDEEENQDTGGQPCYPGRVLLPLLVRTHEYTRVNARVDSHNVMRRASIQGVGSIS